MVLLNIYHRKDGKGIGQIETAHFGLTVTSSETGLDVGEEGG
jgi:hypothetical protein